MYRLGPQRLDGETGRRRAVDAARERDERALGVRGFDLLSDELDEAIDLSVEFPFGESQVDGLDLLFGLLVDDRHSTRPLTLDTYKL